MHALKPDDIISLWEIASAAPPLERPARMLAAALGESAVAAAELPLGGRDALLLELREATFGPSMSGFALCPDCGEKLEIDLDTRTLRSAGAPREHIGGDGTTRWRLRPLSSADVVAAAALGIEGAAAELLKRAVVELERDGRPIDVAMLDGDGALERIEADLAECDPLAEIMLALRCPACLTDWSMPFDAASFLYAELSTAARRLVSEVHALASAYGWTQSEILALSPARRESYLEMIA